VQAAVNQDVHQSRRAAILEAAESVFADAGYDRARLEDVALRVGIRRASLFHHFPDKGSLYAEVTASMGHDLATRFRRALESDGSPGVRLERTVDEWLDYLTERPTFVRIMLRELADGASEHARPFAEQALTVLAALRAVVDEGQAAGSLLPADGLQVLSASLGASTFLALYGAVLGSGASDVGPTLANRDQHRALLIAMFRNFLGTHRTGPAPETAATDR
jgi:TetR/AcrR family transcriptional regulator